MQQGCPEMRGTMLGTHKTDLGALGSLSGSFSLGKRSYLGLAY